MTIKVKKSNVTFYVLVLKLKFYPHGKTWFQMCNQIYQTIIGSN